MLFNKKQEWNKKELIIANNHIIGYVVDRQGTETPTKIAKIHYSKTGVHVVPASPKLGEL